MFLIFVGRPLVFISSMVPMWSNIPITSGKNTLFKKKKKELVLSYELHCFLAL